ncbi:MAG: Crp/Fnr family transcriptional regulator [Pseudomonadota bacterium]
MTIQTHPAIFDFLQQHAAETENVSAPAGARICMQGDQCSSLIILTQGVVRVYKPAADGRRITLYQVKASQSCILTAGCILNATPFPAIAEAETDVSGIAIAAADVTRWLDESRLWRDYLFSLVAGRLEHVIELVDALAFQRLDARLARWLLQQQTDGTISTTHQQVAEELGSSREVISRLLKDLENSGLVSLSRGRIEVTDQQGLTSLIETL